MQKKYTYKICDQDRDTVRRQRSEYRFTLPNLDVLRDCIINGSMKDLQDLISTPGTTRELDLDYDHYSYGLYTAIDIGDLQKVKLLVQHGADPDIVSKEPLPRWRQHPDQYFTTFIEAIKSGHKNIEKFFSQHCNIYKSLKKSIVDKDYALFDYILENYPVDVNQEFGLPLRQQISFYPEDNDFYFDSNKHCLVRYILLPGNDFEIKLGEQEQIKFIVLLIKHGLDLNKALESALEEDWDNFHFIDFFLYFGADPRYINIISQRKYCNYIVMKYNKDSETQLTLHQALELDPIFSVGKIYTSLKSPNQQFKLNRDITMAIIELLTGVDFKFSSKLVECANLEKILAINQQTLRQIKKGKIAKQIAPKLGQQVKRLTQNKESIKFELAQCMEQAFLFLLQ